MEARRGCQVSRNCSYRWLWDSVWVLGTKPGFLGRAASALRGFAISPTPMMLVLEVQFCGIRKPHFSAEEGGRRQSYSSFCLDDNIEVNIIHQTQFHNENLVIASWRSFSKRRLCSALSFFMCSELRTVLMSLAPQSFNRRYRCERSKILNACTIQTVVGLHTLHLFWH